MSCRIETTILEILLKYYDISQIQNLKICDQNKSLSLFHLNKCSLSNNFDDFQLLIQSTYVSFDVTAISDSKIIKKAISK